MVRVHVDFNLFTLTYTGMQAVTLMAVFMLQMLISSDEFNVSDVKVVWYKNGAYMYKTRRRNT